jgi:hypothetical protein
MYRPIVQQSRWKFLSIWLICAVRIFHFNHVIICIKINCLLLMQFNYSKLNVNIIYIILIK